MFLLRVKSIFSMAYPNTQPEAYETNTLLIQRYLLGLPPRTVQFILEKLEGKNHYILNEVWELACLAETIKAQ